MCPPAPSSPADRLSLRQLPKLLRQVLAHGFPVRHAQRELGVPGGAVQVPPVAEEASKKEWQRSKFCERMRAKNFGYRNRSCHGFAVTEGSSGVDRHRLRRTGRGRALSRPVLGCWIL